MLPSEFRAEVNREEIRVIWLSHSEYRMTVTSMSHFDTAPACDRQTDKRTDLLLQRSA